MDDMSMDKEKLLGLLGLAWVAFLRAPESVSPPPPLDSDQAAEGFADTVTEGIETTPEVRQSVVRADDVLSITGQVLDEAGRPVVDAVVTVEMPGRVESAVTLRDGRFEVRGLLEGAYQVAAVKAASKST